jgi:hypothetical protein
MTLLQVLSFPLQKGLRFFRPLPAVPPTAALRLTCPACAGRSDDLSTFLATFLVIVYGRLRWDLYTGGGNAFDFRAETLAPGNLPPTPASTGKQAFDLSAP